MMIISYIRNHLKMHIMICALFSLLFTMELILNGEMFYGLGLNTAGLKETTYSFGVFNYDKSIATKLIDPGIGYSDVCFALITEDRDLVTYPCGIDNRRLESDTGVPVLQNGQILTSGGFEASVLRDEDGNVRTIDDIEINGVMLKNTGKIEIKNSYYAAKTASLYCNIDTFNEVLSGSGSIVVSYAFDHRLSSGEQKALRNEIGEICGTGFETYSPVTDSEERDSLLSSADRIIFLFLAVLLASICFGRMMRVLIVRRKPEYMIFELCGASRLWIKASAFLHLLLTAVVSSILGIAEYMIIRYYLPDMIIYTRDTAVFWALSYAIYLAAVIIMIICVLISTGRTKYEY